jgi:hypothetical protein
VEQTGPVRAVVKIEGVHKNDGAASGCPSPCASISTPGPRRCAWCTPSSSTAIDKRTSSSGLGLAFSVPMREQVHNRHVRFSGEGDGLWAEPVAAATARPLRCPGRHRLPRPTRGQAHRQQGDVQRARAEAADRLGGVGRFQAGATTADGFTIQKRTNPQSCWLDAIAGRRASGLVFAGDVSGGLAVGVKNFWQSYPASLEVRHHGGRRPNCASGCGRPTRPPWTCATTTPRRTGWIPATKTCSPASARRTAWRAPAR